MARLGIAFQLTNFIRDVREDYALDRVYLPAEDRARFGVSEADIAGARVTPGFRALMAGEVARARELFAATAALSDALARPCAPACAWPATSTAACSTASRRSASTSCAGAPPCRRGRSSRLVLGWLTGAS